MQLPNVLISVGRFSPADTPGLLLRQVTLGLGSLCVICEQFPGISGGTIRWETTSGETGEDFLRTSEFTYAVKLAQAATRPVVLSAKEFTSIVEKLVFSVVRSSPSLTAYLRSETLYGEITGFMEETVAAERRIDREDSNDDHD